MNKISIESHRTGNTYVIYVSGIINAETLGDYRNYVDRMMKELDVENKNKVNFVVDYGGVEDVDAATIANILDRLENDVRSDHVVVFSSVPDKFREMVKIHKTEKTIIIYENEKEALKALET